MALLSFRAYARHRGVTLHAVQKAISLGRIKTIIDAEGKRKIDPEQADRDWSDTTDASKQRGSHTPDAGDTQSVGGSYAAARAVRENYQARLAKLNYEQRAGKLVDAEQVREAWGTVITNAKTKLLAVPSKARYRIPHLTLEDISVLEDLVREALKELSECQP